MFCGEYFDLKFSIFILSTIWLKSLAGVWDLVDEEVSLSRISLGDVWGSRGMMSMMKSKNGSTFPSNGQFIFIDKILNPSPFCNNDLDSTLLPINPIYNSNYLLLNSHFIFHSYLSFLTLPPFSPPDQIISLKLIKLHFLSFKLISLLLSQISFLFLPGNYQINSKTCFTSFKPTFVIQYLKSFISRHLPIKI